MDVHRASTFGASRARDLGPPHRPPRKPEVAESETPEEEVSIRMTQAQLGMMLRAMEPSAAALQPQQPQPPQPPAPACSACELPLPPRVAHAIPAPEATLPQQNCLPLPSNRYGPSKGPSPLIFVLLGACAAMSLVSLAVAALAIQRVACALGKIERVYARTNDGRRLI